MAVYDWPEDLLLPLSVKVGTEPWEPIDRDKVLALEHGDLTFQRNGAWYDGPTSAGVRKLHLYPPINGEVAIVLEWVFRPAPISGSEPPTEIPEEFHLGLLYESAAYYYETVEDNPELAQRNSEKADSVANELAAYDSERRLGRGVFMPAIQGWTG